MSVRGTGALVVTVATILLGVVTRVPWTASAPGDALLRLSWRIQSEVAERCRPLTAEEKADLPVHMQVPEVCETRAVPYRLEVAVDGATVVAETIHAAGARADRPLRVFREIPLSAGTHEVRIAFSPVEDEEEDERAEEEDEEEDEEEEESEEDREEPEGTGRLEYADTIRLGGREIALVTLDPGRRTLVRVAPR